MYTEPTVIITGAGASRHYGYPTGSELIKEIVSAAQPLRNCLAICRTEDTARDAIILRGMYYEHVMRNMNDFIDRIYDGNPEVIDYFIGLNADLEEEAKFLIAYVIIHRESKFLKADRTSYINGNEDWLRFVAREYMQRLHAVIRPTFEQAQFRHIQL